MTRCYITQVILFYIVTLFIEYIFQMKINCIFNLKVAFKNLIVLNMRICMGLYQIWFRLFL